VLGAGFVSGGCGGALPACAGFACEGGRARGAGFAL